MIRVCRDTHVCHDTLTQNSSLPHLPPSVTVAAPKGEK